MEKYALKNFAIFTGKHLCWSLFLLKLQACKFIVKRLQHRGFLVNFLFGGIFKNTFLQSTLWCLLLRIYCCIHIVCFSHQILSTLLFLFPLDHLLSIFQIHFFFLYYHFNLLKQNWYWWFYEFRQQTSQLIVNCFYFIKVFSSSFLCWYIKINDCDLCSINPWTQIAISFFW